MRWTEQTTLGFVKLYGKHECLWNTTHPSYKIKSDREEAYKEMSADFKDNYNVTMTVNEIKHKIRTLRTTYMQEVNKILEKSSPESIHVPTLFWFDEMDRILKNVPTRSQTPRYTILPQSKQELADSSTLSWDGSDVHKETDINEKFTDPLISQSEEDLKMQVSTSEPDDIKTFKKTLKKKKLDRNKNNSYRTNRIMNSDNINRSINVQPVIEDEFDIYSRYIATQLRSMKVQEALRLQLQIQRLISESRISNLENE